MTWMEVALLGPLLLEARPRRVTCVSLLLASAVAVILATRFLNYLVPCADDRGGSRRAHAGCTLLCGPAFGAHPLCCACAVHAYSDPIASAD